MVTVAGILALSGVAMAQREGDAKSWMGGMSHELVASANCPQLNVTKEKITEDQARDLAQQYADKNLAGFKVVRPSSYGGGYNTVCYKIDSPATGRYQSFYSVEYSIDAKNSAAETRNLRVDQFGYVTEFAGPFNVAGERGPAGPMGPAGAQGAQGSSGSVGSQGPAGPVGSQGSSGSVGSHGPAGPVGSQGSSGSVGPQAMAGSGDRMASSGMGNNSAAFKDILFDTDKSDIRSNEMSKIADIAAHVKQNAPMQVSIGGFADPRGTDQHNQGLSERRVSAIRDALVTAGVASDKIQTSAFGEQKPLCNESTDACWQRDRRVDVGFRTGN
jgi:outer membrane protein OmpA-like peptidoglycan-associated protein